MSIQNSNHELTSRSSSLSPAEDVRLAQIVNALENLNRCVEERGKTKETWGLLLGEMDWRRELERLLYEM